MRDSVEHLFRVVTRIDSLLIGDNQIFKQVKDSFIISEEMNFAGFLIKRLMDAVVRVGKRAINETAIPENALVATGSLRRRAQLQHLRPDIKVVDLRGNVPSRIKKFLESDWDAIILAHAGVERLGLKKYISSYIRIEEIRPAVEQGALGIEIHQENSFAEDLMKSIHHQDTFIAVSAERALLRTLEGGCQVPIGAFAEVKSNGLC